MNTQAHSDLLINIIENTEGARQGIDPIYICNELVLTPEQFIALSEGKALACFSSGRDPIAIFITKEPLIESIRFSDAPP